MRNLDEIECALNPYRLKLKKHEMYKRMCSLDDIRLFMEQHVFAVWDFMSLLKALQRELTCIEVPWIPSSNASVSRFINEIVVAEESDLNELGEVRSHFEMYIDAMKEIEANTLGIDLFMDQIKAEKTWREASINLPEAIREFLAFTFQTIGAGKIHEIAAAFTYGREDIIPDMFIEIINCSSKANQYDKLLYYLNRHIELDGDEHGPLSLKMISLLCGNDEQKWEEVLQTAIKALEVRLKLWDSILNSMQNEKRALDSSRTVLA